jgi:uncharacterized membrane protein YvlD (DUF360 family)
MGDARTARSAAGARAGTRGWVRILVVLVLTSAALLLLAAVLPGFAIDDVASALAAALLLGIVNALVWPALVRFALPLTVLTLGLGPLLLNGVVVLVIDDLLPGVHVDGYWWALAVAFGLTAVAMAATSLLALDDDAMYFRHVAGPAARRRSGPVTDTDVPGVLFLQIDGLSHPVLQRAMRNGDAPTLARWVSSGSHHLVRWETDWSSQTGVSQAGLLMGANHDMPAFRWLEKDSGELFVSNHPKSAAALEQRLSTGTGLLAVDGASRGNIFTGDAADAVLTMSVAGKRKGRVGAGYYGYFSRPSAVIRTLLGCLAEIVREVHQAAAARRVDVQPRVHRGGAYPLLRAFTTIITRDVLVATLIDDMRLGRSVVYADFVGYDEVAHHSGVERRDALGALRDMDRELGRIERASRLMTRPYRIVVLSDHGQSQGPTFRTRYGETLEEVVRAATGAGVQLPAPDAPAGQESWGYAGGAVQEVAAGPGVVGRVARRLGRGRRAESGDVLLGTEQGTHEAPAGSDVVVLASGNCGLVYLTSEPDRMTLERIGELYGDLVPTLVRHPGIGFVLVRSADRGPLVIGANGELELSTGVVRGTDPLEPFGPSARAQVLHTDSFPHCADLMLNSVWDGQTDEVCAFEELVGSHGGLGGDQTRPFILYPADLSEPGRLHGAVAVHRQMRGWLTELGQPSPLGQDAPSVAQRPAG